MERVFLTVEFDESYALMYAGVTDGNDIYAKLIQLTGCPTPEYIQVSEDDTVDCTKQVENLCDSRRTLCIETDDVENDIRIFAEKPVSHEILAEIEESIQEAFS